ncbi:hypothetical protein, partial [Dysosmobacter sp.]|uniref:hypothetical protein n=1 Tax=Dysosmobacter sp. TaxID=2591382 RepID=UPI002A9B212B
AKRAAFKTYIQTGAGYTLPARIGDFCPAEIGCFLPAQNGDFLPALTKGLENEPYGLFNTVTDGGIKSIYDYVKEFCQKKQ